MKQISDLTKNFKIQKTANSLFDEQVQLCMKYIGEKKYERMCGKLARAGIKGKQAQILFDLIRESEKSPIANNIGLTINWKLKQRRLSIKSK